MSDSGTRVVPTDLPPVAALETAAEGRPGRIEGSGRAVQTPASPSGAGAGPDGAPGGPSTPARPAPDGPRRLGAAGSSAPTPAGGPASAPPPVRCPRQGEAEGGDLGRLRNAAGVPAPDGSTAAQSRQGARKAWRAAESALAKAKRNGRGRYPVKRRGDGYGPGMSRRMPPQPPGGAA